MTYQLNQSSLVSDPAAGAYQDIVIGDQLLQFCAIALSFLRPIVALRGSGELGIAQVVTMSLMAGGGVRRLSQCGREGGQEQERSRRRAKQGMRQRYLHLLRKPLLFQKEENSSGGRL